MNLVWFMSINPFWWQLSCLLRGCRGDDGDTKRRVTSVIRSAHSHQNIRCLCERSSLVTYCLGIMDVVGQCWCCGSKCDVVSWESSLMTILWPDTRDTGPVVSQSEDSVVLVWPNRGQLTMRALSPVAISGPTQILVLRHHYSMKSSSLPSYKTNIYS